MACSKLHRRSLSLRVLAMIQGWYLRTQSSGSKKTHWPVGGSGNHFQQEASTVWSHPGPWPMWGRRKVYAQAAVGVQPSAPQDLSSH